MDNQWTIIMKWEINEFLRGWHGQKMDQQHLPTLDKFGKFDLEENLMQAAFLSPDH